MVREVRCHAHGRPGGDRVAVASEGFVGELSCEPVGDGVVETEALLDNSGEIGEFLEGGEGRRVGWVGDCGFEFVM